MYDSLSMAKGGTMLASPVAHDLSLGDRHWAVARIGFCPIGEGGARGMMATELVQARDVIVHGPVKQGRNGCRWLMLAIKPKI